VNPLGSASFFLASPSSINLSCGPAGAAAAGVAPAAGVVGAPAAGGLAYPIAENVIIAKVTTIKVYFIII